MTGMIRRAAWVAAALVLVATPSLASDKEECANAAEQAQRLRAEKKLRESRAQFVHCGREVCPGFIRNDCLKWLRDVDAALPTVIFRVRDPDDKDLIKVKVLVDGEVFVSELDGTAVAVDTGAHTFRYEAEGMEPYEERVLISQGEKDRVLKAKLVPKGHPAASPDNHGVQGNTTGGSGPQPDNATPPGADKPSHTNVPAWVVGGVGAAGLVMFGILETVGQIGYSNLQSGCGATAQKCTEDDIAPVRTELQIALVGLAVGVVGIGVSAVLFAVGGSSSSPAARAASHVEITPVAGGATAGLRFSL
jgi:hypothetical protein